MNATPIEDTVIGSLDHLGVVLDYAQARGHVGPNTVQMLSDVHARGGLEQASGSEISALLDSLNRVHLTYNSRDLQFWREGRNWVGFLPERDDSKSGMSFYRQSFTALGCMESAKEVIDEDDRRLAAIEAGEAFLDAGGESKLASIHRDAPQAFEDALALLRGRGSTRELGSDCGDAVLTVRALIKASKRRSLKRSEGENPQQFGVASSWKAIEGVCFEITRVEGGGISTHTIFVGQPAIFGHNGRDDRYGPLLSITGKRAKVQERMGTKTRSMPHGGFVQWNERAFGTK